MYYLKRGISLVLLFVVCYWLLRWEAGNDYKIQAGVFTAFAIDWLFHLAAGVCLGGFFCGNMKLKTSRAENVTVFILLAILSLGFGWMLLGLNIELHYLKVAIYELAPLFQVLLGFWAFLNVYARATAKKQRKEQEHN